jgi:hypothetical protein
MALTSTDTISSPISSDREKHNPSRVTTSLRKLLAINVEAHALMCTRTVCKSGSTTDVCRSLLARATGYSRTWGLFFLETKQNLPCAMIPLRHTWLNQKELDMERKSDTPQTPRSPSVLQHMCTKWVLDDRSVVTIYLCKFLPITKISQHHSPTSIFDPGWRVVLAIQHEVELQFFSHQ